MLISRSLMFGSQEWIVRTTPEQLVAYDPPAGSQSVREAVTAALESPFQIESLARCLTPEDQVAVVIDPTIEGVSTVVQVLLEYLVRVGLPLTAVTLVLPPDPTGRQIPVPSEFAAVRQEIHNPDDRPGIAYLATTLDGKRLYLNRKVVEADFVVLVNQLRPDPVFGYRVGPTHLFPTLSDRETLDGQNDSPKVAFIGESETVARQTADDVAWRLGTPFSVQLIPGPANTLVEVVGGLADAIPEAVRRYDRVWRRELTGADVVLAVVPDPDATVEDVVRAAANAVRACVLDGRVVVLAPAVDWSSEAFGLLRTTDEPIQAVKRLAKRLPHDTTARLWAKVARRCRLSLANCDEDTAGELFASAVAGPDELQRLVDAAERLLILSDARRAILDVAT